MTEQQTPHHVLLAVLRARLSGMVDAYEYEGSLARQSKASELLSAFDVANENYIRAKTTWITNNTDETMIALIGTWARLGRVRWEIQKEFNL